MDDFLMYKYLQEKSKGGSSDKGFMEFLANKVMSRRGRGRGSMRNTEGMYEDMYDYYPEMKSSKYNMMDDRGLYEMYKFMKETGQMDEHFDAEYARQLVSEMFHFQNGRKITGEKFDMHKAIEVLNKYKGVIPPNITEGDVYVAINAQYHDYCSLFKTWFGSNADSKIIESAIVFWFKDTDYDKGFKLGNYFSEGY